MAVPFRTAYFHRSQRVANLMPCFRAILLSLSFLIGTALLAQDEDKDRLTEALKGLPGLSTDAERDELNSVIKKELVRILEGPDAFTTSFRDVPISLVDGPDGKFRLFTWNIPRNDGSHHYEGVLLTMHRRTAKIFELRDMTDNITGAELPELGPDRWYGAVYYEVIPVKKGGKEYYTLLGWKGSSNVETRKVIEVLHFKGGSPRFGAPLFAGGKHMHSRKVFGYSHQATMTLRYDDTATRIILDHLSPRVADMEGQWAFYGPDLSYDAYVWDKDRWRFERDIDVREIRRPGERPRPFNPPPKEPRP